MTISQLPRARGEQGNPQVLRATPKRTGRLVPVWWEAQGPPAGVAWGWGVKECPLNFRKEGARVAGPTAGQLEGCLQTQVQSKGGTNSVGTQSLGIQMHPMGGPQGRRGSHGGAGGEGWPRNQVPS